MAKLKLLFGRAETRRWPVRLMAWLMGSPYSDVGIMFPSGSVFGIMGETYRISTPPTEDVDLAGIDVIEISMTVEQVAKAFTWAEKFEGKTQTTRDCFDFILRYFREDPMQLDGKHTLWSSEVVSIILGAAGVFRTLPNRSTTPNELYYAAAGRAEVDSTVLMIGDVSC